MIAHQKLTIQSLQARAVNVPMQRPLQTSGATMVGTDPLVLIDLVTEEGVTACGYVFCSTPLATEPPHALQRPSGLWCVPDCPGDGVGE